MEYRGKSYNVVQGLGANIWKWKVELDEKTFKSGEAKTRAAAETAARWVINEALAPTERKPLPPSGNRNPD
jgi:hypothetical protein